MEEDNLIKEETQADGSHKIVLDLDKLEKRFVEQGSMVELEDTSQGIHIKMLSGKMETEPLAELSARTFNFIKTSRTKKDPATYY